MINAYLYLVNAIVFGFIFSGLTTNNSLTVLFRFVALVLGVVNLLKFLHII